MQQASAVGGGRGGGDQAGNAGVVGEARCDAQAFGGGAEQTRIRGQSGGPDDGAAGLDTAGTAGRDVGEQRAPSVSSEVSGWPGSCAARR